MMILFISLLNTLVIYCPPPRFLPVGSFVRKQIQKIAAVITSLSHFLSLSFPFSSFLPLPPFPSPSPSPSPSPPSFPFLPLSHSVPPLPLLFPFLFSPPSFSPSFP